MEKVYSPRHALKNSLGGGSSAFEAERVSQFVAWLGEPKKILDIGCRDGRVARALLAAGHTVTGFDIDSAALLLCPAEMKTEQHDLNDDWHHGHEEEFDVVIATEVIEHLYYPNKVLERIDTVLKPGGMFIGSVPNPFNVKNRLRLFFARIENTPLAEPTHINHFSYRALGRLLRSRFKDVFITSVGRRRFRLFTRYMPGLMGSTFVFKAHKPIKS